jgi:hypothetical protein
MWLLVMSKAMLLVMGKAMLSAMLGPTKLLLLLPRTLREIRPEPPTNLRLTTRLRCECEG